MKKDGMLGKNRIEDIRWLCSLSKSELDLLISLKKMVTRRQSSILKKKGTRRVSVTKHKSLSKKFDLKMLRDLSFVLMQVVKERLVDIPQMAESSVEIVKERLVDIPQKADSCVEIVKERLVDIPQMAESCVENGKERLVDIPQMAEVRVENSNLAKYEISEEFREMGVEELMTHIHPDNKKRISKRISKLFGIDDTHPSR